VRSTVLIVLLALSLLPVAQASDENDNDSAATGDDDGKDPGRGRLLPIPLIITEPAIGEGLGGGLVYFHRDSSRDRPTVTSGRSLANTNAEQTPPPTATGLFGAYTTNDTWVVGVGHSHTFNEDSWRMVGALARARINATIYLADLPFLFSLDGAVLYANFKNRVGETPWFIGGSFSVADADATFDIGPDSEILPDFSFTDVGVAALGIYDSRDDTMMPATGQLFDLTVWRYDESLGGDFNYNTARFKANSFHTFAEKIVLGLRFEVGAASGNVPFYAEPFVPLRGVPALRYQGEIAGVVEIEGRYQFAERWAGLAFAGVGFVDERDADLATDQDIQAWGVGARYLALREQNVWVGLDLARGPEEDAYYIQLTHPW